MEHITRQEMLAATVKDFLDSKELHYDVIGDDNEIFTLHMPLRGCKLNNCRLFIKASDDSIQTHAVCPINASPDVYDKVVEFITRANYGLKLGNFEFDYSDGEIRYQTCQDMEEGVPGEEDVAHHILIAYSMMKRYGDGLVKSLMGFGDPKADIAEIEG